MSQPDSLGNPGGIYEERPRSNVYTAMLGVSLVALILASAVLAWELNQYKWDYKGDAVKAITLRPPVAAPPRGVLPTATADGGATVDTLSTPAAPAAPATPAVPAATAAVPAATVPAVPAATVPAVPAATGAATPAAPAVTPPVPLVPAAPNATGTATGAGAPPAATPTATPAP